MSEYQEAILKNSKSIETKRDELMAVALFFRFLHDFGYIEDNPALALDPPKKPHHLPRNILGPTEISYLLSLPDKNTLIGMRDYCVMSLLYSSMMRTKELFNLKLEDIDLRLKQAIVRRTKNKSDRIVHIDTYTAFYLKKYKENARTWLLKGEESEYLFINMTGAPLNRNAFARYFALKYAPIIKERFNKYVTPYSFRHSSATHWLDSGARNKKDVLPHVQRQLGHKSLDSTAIYTYVAIEPLREMFKNYHPRDLALKKLHAIPSPEDIIKGKNHKS